MAVTPVQLTLSVAPARRDALIRRVRLLVAATIAYNVVEAVVALTAGTLASSSALLKPTSPASWPNSTCMNRPTSIDAFSPS